MIAISPHRTSQFKANAQTVLPASVMNELEKVKVAMAAEEKVAEDIEEDENDAPEPDFVILHFNDVYHIQATRSKNKLKLKN